MRAPRCLVLPFLLVAATTLHAQPSLLVYDFTLGTADPVANVDEVRAVGYSGIVTRVRTVGDLKKLRTYVRYVATLDGFRLVPYVAYDFNLAASANVWRLALPTLASAGAPLWVVVRNAPSQDAVHALVWEMARTSQALGVRTVLYPHWGTDIPTAAHASAIIAAVGHPNLRNSLHTYHEILGGNQDELPDVAAGHAAETALVGIAGADDDVPPTSIPWADVIKPLDEGGHDLLPFLQALEDAGYDGPVILQTFGITSNPGHLKRSIRTYAEYVNQIVPAGA